MLPPPDLDQACPGLVFQIDPEFDGNKAFAGCFLVATEIKTWGVQGYVQALGETRSERGGLAYIRIKWEDIEFIGTAVWACINN